MSLCRSSFHLPYFRFSPVVFEALVRDWNNLTQVNINISTKTKRWKLTPLTAVLTVRFRSSRIGKAVHQALLPDNINLPKGMKINQVVRGKNLTISVTCDSIETMINTLDEFTSHMDVALKAIEVEEK